MLTWGQIIFWGGLILGGTMFYAHLKQTEYNYADVKSGNDTKTYKIKKFKYLTQTTNANSWSGPNYQVYSTQRIRIWPDQSVNPEWPREITTSVENVNLYSK